MIKLIAESTIAASLFSAGVFMLYFAWKRRNKAKKIKKLMGHVIDLFEKNVGTGNIFTEEKEIKTNRHNLEMAKWILDQIRSLEPGHALALHYYGMYYLKLGNLIDAEKLCKKAESIDPDNFIIQNGLGLVFEQKGNLDRANAYFEKACRNNPDNTDFHNALRNRSGKVYRGFSAGLRNEK